MAKNRIRKLKEIVPAEPVVYLKKYVISLKYRPDTVIEAESPEDAWEKYCRFYGIVATEWKPEIKETDGEYRHVEHD